MARWLYRFELFDGERSGEDAKQSDSTTDVKRSKTRGTSGRSAKQGGPSRIKAGLFDTVARQAVRRALDEEIEEIRERARLDVLARREEIRARTRAELEPIIEAARERRRQGQRREGAPPDEDPVKDQEEAEWNGIGTSTQICKRYGIGGSPSYYFSEGHTALCNDGRRRRVDRVELDDEDKEVLETKRAKWGYRLERLPGDVVHGRYLPEIQPDEQEAEQSWPVASEDQASSEQVEEFDQDEAPQLEQLAAREAQEVTPLPPTNEGPHIKNLEALKQLGARVQKEVGNRLSNAQMVVAGGVPDHFAKVLRLYARQQQIEASAVARIASVIDAAEAEAAEIGVEIDWPQLLSLAGWMIKNEEVA